MKRNPTERHDPRETPEEAHARRTMDSTAYRAFLNQNLVRKIRAWAKFHEKCPNSGCRRNGRCLKTEACRAVSREPTTDEERMAMGRRVRKVLEAEMARRAAEGEPRPSRDTARPPIPDRKSPPGR